MKNKITDHERQVISDIWVDFETYTGHRDPTRSTMNEFITHLMWELCLDFTIPQITTWIQSYFIPESIEWLTGE